VFWRVILLLLLGHVVELFAELAVCMSAVRVLNLFEVKCESSMG